MKTLSYLIPVLAIAATVVSCNKEQIQADHSGSSSQEIVLSVAEEGLSVETRATAISTLPGSLYLSATTGTTSQVSKWPSQSVTVSSGKINTGKYQTATPTSYNYYLSNEQMAFAAGGCTISASNTTDIIVGLTKGSTSTTPSVTMNHIFARTGSVKCESGNEMTLSNLSYKIQSKSGSSTGTKGTYNIYTGEWSSATALSSTTLTSSSDMYLIPGTYTFTVSGTASIGDYSKSFTASADVALQAGKINNIQATYDAAVPDGIVISVTLTPWGNVTLTPEVQ